jgi:hypothetical protein
MPKYEIKNLKTGPSREWGPNGAVSCTLYRDGKRVAKFFDAGDGGEAEIEWLDGDKPKVDVTIMNYTDEGYTRKGTPEEKILAEHTNNMFYDRESSSGKPLRMGMDGFIFKLIATFEENKQFKRWCKKETCFRLKGDEAGHWRTVKHPFNPDVKTFIVKKYGDQIEEILNERFAS